MDGFVTDYISSFLPQMDRQPTFEEYSQIMTGYLPEDLRCSTVSLVTSVYSTTGSPKFPRRRS